MSTRSFTLASFIERRRRLIRSACALNGADDAGFSLVEAVVAMVLTALLATGIAGNMIAGYVGLSTSRMSQQASNLAQAALESARDTTYSKLAMATGDLSSDGTLTTGTILTTCSGNPGNFLGPGSHVHISTCEPIVSVTSGASIPTHVSPPQTLNGHTFEVKEYVTAATLTLADHTTTTDKRVTVLVSWMDRGKVRTFSNSTLISPAASGLQLPKYTPPTAVTVTAAAGSQATMAFTITNQGAEDTYDLSMTDPSGRSWKSLTTFYLDTNANGGYDPGIDTALQDTNGNGFFDTGDVQPNGVVHFLVVWTIPSTDTLASGITYTLTVTSGTSAALSQTISSTVNNTVNVASQNQYFTLLNGSSPNCYDTGCNGNTATQSPTVSNQNPMTAKMAMPPSGTAPVASGSTAPYAYSDDVSGFSTTPGRYLSSGTNKFAAWWYQLPSRWTIAASTSIPATVNLWVLNQSCMTSVTLTFALKDYNSTLTSASNIVTNVTATVPGDGSQSTTPCLAPVAVPVTLSTSLASTLNANTYLQLSVTSTQPVMLYYDSPTYPSTLTLSRTS